MTSKPFSIFLLKEGYNENNSLRENHNLEKVSASRIPKNGTLYVLDAEPKDPWWKYYFSIGRNLQQQFKGAILFLPIENRCFALTFGHVAYHLDDNSYEYDFGLVVTLNSVDPTALKSADMIAPGLALHKRTQLPVLAELTYLDFDANSEIIKSLTGRVKSEYQNLFKSATGSVSLRVSLNAAAEELPNICSTLLDLYRSVDYRSSFPNIHNILPTKDPITISKLEDNLISSIRSKDPDVTLAIPDIVDYRDNTCCVFSGWPRRSPIYPDISLESFYDFIGEDYKILRIDDLRCIKITLTNVDGMRSNSYNIYRSLVYDTKLPGEDAVYHLCDGKWYRVEQSYIQRLKSYLDNKYTEPDLPPYDHDVIKDGKIVYSEENYNRRVADDDPNAICLDQEDISPPAMTSVEPCDIYRVYHDSSARSKYRANFYHLKISTRSSSLSHLFNQGINSVDLLQLEKPARDKLRNLILSRLNHPNSHRFIAPLDNFDFKVTFGIITHKDRNARSDNLPLFSRISLMRIMKNLDVRQIPSAFMFIDDQSPRKDGHQNDMITVEVVEISKKRKEIRPITGEKYDSSLPVKRCNKKLKEAPPGTRFRVAVRMTAEGTLSSHHSWPFEPLD